jgi:hypothetical protein
MMNHCNLSDEEEAYELSLLQRAITINNEAFVHSPGMCTVPQNRTAEDLLESLKEGLGSFHALLVQRSGSCDANTALLARSHEVSFSFSGTPLVSSTSPLAQDTSSSRTRNGDSMMTDYMSSSHQNGNFTGLYLFSHPVVFDYSNVSARPHNSPCSPLPRLLSWSGTRSICVLVGCNIFNLALLNHQRVVEECNALKVRHVFLKSLKLYQSAQVLLQRRVDELQTPYRRKMMIDESSLVTGGGLIGAPGPLREETKMLTLLLVATWNNMSQIHYFLENFAQSQFCLQRLLILIGNTRSWCRHDPLAMEFLNQVLFNVMVIRKHYHSSPAAAA